MIVIFLDPMGSPCALGVEAARIRPHYVRATSAG
jgi:hypothetical protein